LTLRHWYQGRLLHFNDLMQWVSIAWLPLALVWLLWDKLSLRLKY